MTFGIAFGIGVLVGITISLIWLAIGSLVFAFLPSATATHEILEGLREPAWKCPADRTAERSGAVTPDRPTTTTGES